MGLNLLIVAAGGALGAAGRYLLTLLTAAAGLHPVAGTLAANVAGSLAIGFASGSADGRRALFLSVGVCGGFTTFSTFSAQTLSLLQEGRLVAAALYAFGSVALCVAGTLAGFALAARC
ncbi:MAG: CrcB family protein [Prevotellaceae bacterium]|nr:CrcB family protein [Prevotellaceae bacterium]